MPLFDLTYDLPGLKLADLPVRFSSRLPCCHHQHFDSPLSFNFFFVISLVCSACWISPATSLPKWFSWQSINLSQRLKNLFLACPSHPELHAHFSVLSAHSDVCVPYRRTDTESITGDTHSFRPSIREPCINSGSNYQLR